MNDMSKDKKTRLECTEGTKPPRNTKSWKTEARSLEALLVRACKYISTQTKMGAAESLSLDAELSGWWAAHQDSAENRQLQLKKTGLAKLSDDERAALGLET